ncbi:hypothetical protein RV10_GL002666 [Enterococcus pallens]|nr:hypothetical protein RV10_GL002666 [Enterococcus pallens]
MQYLGIPNDAANQLVFSFQNTIAEELVTSTSNDLIKLIGGCVTSLEEALILLSSEE